MIGALVITIVIVVLLPVAFLMTGAVASALLGWFLRSNAEEEHAGSELVDLNV